MDEMKTNTTAEENTTAPEATEAEKKEYPKDLGASFPKQCIGIPYETSDHRMNVSISLPQEGDKPWPKFNVDERSIYPKLKVVETTDPETNKVKKSIELEPDNKGNIRKMVTVFLRPDTEYKLYQSQKNEQGEWTKSEVGSMTGKEIKDNRDAALNAFKDKQKEEKEPGKDEKFAGITEKAPEKPAPSKEAEL